MTIPFALDNPLMQSQPATHQDLAFALDQAQGLGTRQELPSKAKLFHFQPTISREQVWDLAYFPKGENVVISADGVFVPSTLFGPSPDLSFNIQMGPYGREVIIFSQSNPSYKGHVSKEARNQESEQRWLVTNRSIYLGQWVALAGDRLLASGSNATVVYKQARALGVTAPFVAYIDAEYDLPFAGW